MGERGTADQPVHLDGLGEPGHDIVGQLPKKALEQDLFVDGHIAQTPAAGRAGRPSYPNCSD